MPTATTPQPVVTSVSPMPTTTATAEEPEPPAPAGEGNLLTPNEDLWVGPSSNGVGVTGSWYGYQDEATTGCCEDLLTWDAGTVCMAGTTAATADGVWGAGMGFTMNEEEVWDGSAYSGFSFTATVESDVTIQVRVKLATTVVDDGAEHYVELQSGVNTINWTDLAQPAWYTESNDEVPFDPSDIEALQFHVPAGTAENAFSVCISELTIE
jgi:hypothetical protein